MSGTNNTKQTQSTSTYTQPIQIDSNNLNNYSITNDTTDQFAPLFQSFLASDTGYSLLTRNLGDQGTETELKLDIIDLGFSDEQAIESITGERMLGTNDKLVIEDILAQYTYGDNKTILDDSLFLANYMLEQIKNYIQQPLVGTVGFKGDLARIIEDALGTGMEENLDNNFIFSHNYERDMSGHEEHLTDATDISNALHDAYDIVGPLIGMPDIEAEFATLYKKHADAIKATKSGASRREQAHSALLQDARDLSAKIIEGISTKIANIDASNPTTEDMKFLDAVATWIKFGLHSSEENGENGHKVHGIHSLADGSNEEKRAFQIAHVMNAGNDTLIGQILRNTTALDSLNGQGLLQFINDNGGNFEYLFHSEGVTKNGEDSVVNEGEISTMYGASGSASVNAQKEHGMGARQNLWGHNQAFLSYNGGVSM